MVIQVDDFFTDFDSFDKYVRRLPFEGLINPADGVEYPDISIDIPKAIRAEYKQSLEDAAGWPVKINQLFLRNTDTTTPTAPHQAHTDTIQGTHIALVYMQDGPKGAGTSLVKHKALGFDKDPETQEEFDAWKRDVNTPDAWEITALLEMKANRLVAGIWSALMHRAEPIHGFGTSPQDGRIVLICFYERAA